MPAPKKSWESTRTWPNDHIILDAETLGSLADSTPVPIQPFSLYTNWSDRIFNFIWNIKEVFLRFQISAPCKNFPGMDQLCEQRLAAFNGFAGKCPSGDQHWRALGGTVKRSTQTGALEISKPEVRSYYIWRQGSSRLFYFDSGNSGDWRLLWAKHLREAGGLDWSWEPQLVDTELQIGGWTFQIWSPSQGRY